MKTVELTVPDGGAGERIDAFIAKAQPSLSRSAAARLAEEGGVRIGGRTVRKNYKVASGEVVVIQLPDPEPDSALPEAIPLDVVYEDEDIIVINKPAGMVVHPAAGNRDGTLVNALLHHCGGSLSGIGGVLRPGIVHRIDKDTSGLLVAAKNDAAHASLSAQLKERGVSRVYHAVVTGGMREDAGTVDAPLGRSSGDRKKMAVIRDPGAKSREAVTHWRVLERFSGFTYVECELETGRTHQIRVHMAGIGHPLLGDTVYGGGKTKFEAQNSALICGQCLIAKKLCLTHPRTGERMSFEVPLTAEMEMLIAKLRARSGV